MLRIHVHVHVHVQAKKTWTEKHKQYIVFALVTCKFNSLNCVINQQITSCKRQ